MSCIPAVCAALTPSCRASTNEFVKDSFCIQTGEVGVVCSFFPILSNIFLSLSSSTECLDSILGG